MSTSWFTYYLDRLTRGFPSKYFKNFTAGSIMSAILGSIVSALFAPFEDDYAVYEQNLDPLTATDFWLDFWASFFGESRYFGESDTYYRTRMKAAITYGRNSAQALIESVRPYAVAAPQVIEPRGTVLQNVAYDNTYDYDTQYDGKAFVITLKYRPKSSNPKSFYIGMGYIDQGSYIFSASTSNASTEQKMITEAIKRTKLAGIKVISDIS